MSDLYDGIKELLVQHPQKNVADIASMVGCSPTTVVHAATAYGLSLRGRYDVQSQRIAMKTGYRCPNCDSDNIGVTDTRPTNLSEVGLDGPTTRRRRACRNCGHRWTSIEVTADQIHTMAMALAEPLAEKLILEMARQFYDKEPTT